ncbi:MAG: Nramp family divalent metal transporter [Flavobacteriales bacterium]|nr:Nramp family divalent metal transporter [Flavobacteriales bacterium]
MSVKENKLANFLKTLGPGILFASTAIGVSHLVQSTRAGADYGFALVGFIIAANLFKYPFFEFGSRYANATGESLIDGYKRIGKWMLWLYFIITIISMLFVSAAVGAVTSGFLQNLFGITSWGIYATVVLFVFCVAILASGQYGFLDKLTKVIGSVLLLSTIVAFSLAIFKGPNPQIPDFIPPNIWDEGSMLFIIALMGWMPTAVDLSAWNSLWTLERIKQTGYKPRMKETLADFNLGYIVSAVLSLCFVTLGAYMLYGTGMELPNSSGAFAHAVVGLYTNYIGDWSYIIIATAAFSIMFGTCIAVFDGFARSFERTIELLFLPEAENLSTKKAYNLSLAVIGIGAFLIIFLLGKHIKTLVDLATTISFLIAPLIAVVNYRLVTGNHVRKRDQPAFWLKALSWAGIVFLSGFALYFLYVKFF